MKQNKKELLKWQIVSIILTIFIFVLTHNYFVNQGETVNQAAVIACVCAALVALVFASVVTIAKICVANITTLAGTIATLSGIFFFAENLNFFFAFVVAISIASVVITTMSSAIIVDYLQMTKREIYFRLLAEVIIIWFFMALKIFFF